MKLRAAQDQAHLRHEETYAGAQPVGRPDDLDGEPRAEEQNAPSGSSSGLGRDSRVSGGDRATTRQTTPRGVSTEEVLDAAIELVKAKESELDEVEGDIYSLEETIDEARTTKYGMVQER
jgi:hypothetical protein